MNKYITLSFTQVMGCIGKEGRQLHCNVVIVVGICADRLVLAQQLSQKILIGEELDV